MQWGDLKDLFPGNMHDKSRELRHFITGKCYKLPGFPLSIAPPPTPTSSLFYVTHGVMWPRRLVASLMSQPPMTGKHKRISHCSRQHVEPV